MCVNVSLTPSADISVVVDLYVELGRKSGSFKWVAIKREDGAVLRRDMAYTGAEE